MGVHKNPRTCPKEFGRPKRVQLPSDPLEVFQPKEEERENKMNDERMLKWLEWSHLPPRLQQVSHPFYDLALTICTLCDPGPERTVALRKLLEAKDAAVRAAVHPGN